jgi:hypothetical protein
MLTKCVVIPNVAMLVPAATLTDGATDTAPGWGWATMILPQIEQAPLYNAVNFAWPVPAPPNATVILSDIHTYLCPADLTTGPFPVTDAAGNPLAVAAPSSYAACVGGNETDTATGINNNGLGTGVFFRDSRIRVADITDGTSSTFAMGESATGAYNQNDPRECIGAHYYSFEPLVALSYMPKDGWEASTKLMYNMKTTNQATNYHSGQEFHMDYLTGRHFGGWMLGASGYALKQVTDDTVNGETVPDTPGLWDAGRRGQVLAVGPSAGYTNKHHMTFIAQWQHETLVRNRFGGDKVWFKMVIPAASVFHGSKH